ncbi:uncharacterized protein LOC110875250 [Helianthus annuus]|uniref:uncharacterized protein LOC110875250 n=1 Tax=Helianthus annuus TaxID=4232 RepID=UPI000B8F0546|nr:uncharacterized protein LOC110875250 [Helianthus annuus]
MDYAYVQAIGRSGGLFSLWNPEKFKVDQVVKNHRFLLTSGQVTGLDKKLNIINIHAPNDPPSRRSLWGEIANLITQDDIWVVMGDFNEVRMESERVNSRFDRNLAEVFNNFIENTGLFEYSMVGGNFTFFSGHEEVKMSKLDRYLVNESFLTEWPKTILEVHKRSLSDHCPVSLSCLSADFSPIPFRFFNSWVGESKLDELVNSKLDGLVPWGRWDKAVLGILKDLKDGIRKWRLEKKVEENKEMEGLLASLDRLDEKAAIGPISLAEKKM